MTVTCGGGASATTYIEVSDDFSDGSIWLNADAELRRQKKTARREYRNWTIASVGYAGLAGLAGFFVAGPVGAWIAASATASVAVSGTMAVIKEEKAEDPPRDDFDVVSRFQDLVFNLPAPATDDHERMLTFLSQMTSMIFCERDLILSLERLDGALNSAIVDQGRVGELIDAPFVSEQVGAIVHNASIGSSLALAILSSIPAVDEVYQELVGQLAAHIEAYQGLPPQDVQDSIKNAWASQQADIRTQLGLLASDMPLLNLGIERSVDELVNELGELRPLPNTLFSDDTISNVADMAASLNELAAAYDDGLLRSARPFPVYSSRRGVRTPSE
ncbi:hypothetical protein [Actinomycetospora flava]|uniref:Uncharacterized protein n=1 Tax=Actinomycetospora flava TaxID=3129232 RepID=A0ABU8MEB1_9PSEU